MRFMACSYLGLEPCLKIDWDVIAVASQRMLEEILLHAAAESLNRPGLVDTGGDFLVGAWKCHWELCRVFIAGKS